MGEDGLNFDAANLENAVQGASKVYSFMNDTLLPWGSLLIFILAILFSYWIAKKNNQPAFKWPSISKWPLGLKASLWPLFAAYALTHAFSAGSVYYNTKIANPSVEAYFEAIGTGRLLSLTHAHLFAHATMYFIVATLVQFTPSSPIFRVWAPLVALWAGVFDVFAWWGLKEVSSQFELLSIVCGSSFSVAFLLMSFAVLKESIRRS